MHLSAMLGSMMEIGKQDKARRLSLSMVHIRTTIRDTKYNFLVVIRNRRRNWIRNVHWRQESAVW
jgi:hypothetical protein